MTGEVDDRVAAASAHWGPRFAANGTDYADVQATLARIKGWDDWLREWGVTAQHYESIAETAARDGRLVTAGEAWRRAALCWHWGKFVFVDRPDEQRAAHERTVECFRRGAATLSPPAELVAIPYGEHRLTGYLRVPVPGGAPAIADDAPPPVVIMVPGLDSVKEELQATAEYLLRRGLAVLAVDGPGQGEAEAELPIEPAYERVATAIIDFLAGRAGVAQGGPGGRLPLGIDTERIGLFGVSLGGYYAVRSAAFEPRLWAAVDLAGPYRFDQDWNTLPPQTRAAFRVRSRSATDDQARERAAALTLEEAAPRVGIPLLVVHGGQDRLIPPSHAERIAREAPDSDLFLFPDGNHGLTNHAFESRSLIADWLTARLTSD